MEEIVKFLGTPASGTVLSKLASTGFYILEPDVVDYIEDEKWDFARDLFPYLMRVGEHLFGFASKSFWVAVGELTAYLRAAGSVLGKLDQGAAMDARARGNYK